jgi:hypothetical protein
MNAVIIANTCALCSVQINDHFTTEDSYAPAMFGKLMEKAMNNIIVERWAYATIALTIIGVCVTAVVTALAYDSNVFG